MCVCVCVCLCVCLSVSVPVSVNVHEGEVVNVCYVFDNKERFHINPYVSL